MQSKQCRTCKETKPLSEFSTDNSRIGGKHGQCKACNKIQYYKNVDQNRARSHAWRIAHPGASSANSKAWAKTHPDAYSLSSKAWRLAHPEEYKANHKAWKQANYDKVLASNQRRDALKRGALLSDLTDAQWLEIKTAYDFRCVYCPATCWRCRQKKHKLNLPMRKRRGFQTVRHRTSRGSFRPRVGTGIATTPVAPDQHLPTCFPRQDG